MQASRQKYGAEILMSHPTRLGGSEWMGHLGYAVLVCNRTPYSCRQNASRQLLQFGCEDDGQDHGERVSGRNGGCTSLYRGRHYTSFDGRLSLHRIISVPSPRFAANCLKGRFRSPGQGCPWSLL